MDKIELQIFVVEAFTTGENEQFTGNTAAVCILNYDDDISDELKQKIAFEMNLSETAFISEGWTKENHLKSLKTKQCWTIRWFTPLQEVEICGHATLAAANIIFNKILKNEIKNEHESTTTIQFESKFKGSLGATITWNNNLITLNFPSSPTIPLSINGGNNNNWISELIELTLGKNLPLNTVAEVHYSLSGKIILLRLQNNKENSNLTNEELIKKIKPNFQAMLNIKGNEEDNIILHDVIVTIRGDPEKLDGPHFYSRYFTPWGGIDEDPVTGSAQTVLTPFWKNEFENEGFDLKIFVSKQSSQRGGKLICTLDEDRVHIKGSSRMVLQGSFFI